MNRYKRNFKLLAITLLLSITIGCGLFKNAPSDEFVKQTCEEEFRSMVREAVALSSMVMFTPRMKQTSQEDYNKEQKEIESIHAKEFEIAESQSGQTNGINF